MSKFLDPKADLTFKKVFGEHKNLRQENARTVKTILLP